MIKKRALGKGEKIKKKKNGKMEETSGQILEIIININAFDKQPINKKFWNIKYQAQQFQKRRKKKCFYQK